MAGTARNEASPKRFELCSIFGGVTKSFLARQRLKSLRECSAGISESASPWMNKVEQLTLAIIRLFGKRSLKVQATTRPTMLCTAARMEVNILCSQENGRTTPQGPSKENDLRISHTDFIYEESKRSQSDFIHCIFGGFHVV
eukprot:Skav201968  [mRNA]  locus=scaffold103:280505:280930:- [translate_table: standard]